MKKKPKELSDFEDTLLWMACRYACNRHSIASAVLPCDIIENYYYVMSEDQKTRLSKDVERELKDGEKWGGERSDARWYKMVEALNPEKHFTVQGIDNVLYDCFKVGDIVYPLSAYLANPWREVFIPKENIK